MKDTVLPGAYLYTKELDQTDGTWDGEIAEGFRTQEKEITEQLNAAWTAEQKKAGQRVFEFYLLYEIQESDIPKFFIDNIANLDYNYESHYSTGAQAAAADAEARISVVGSAIDDVPADAWFTAPILWAVEQEITTGMGDGTFGVNGACNRAQIVTFLYRAYN